LRYYAGQAAEIPGLKLARGGFEPEPAPGGAGHSLRQCLHCGQLTQPDKLRHLTALANAYFGDGVAVRVATAEDQDRMSPTDLKTYIDGRPEVRQAVTNLGAEIIERKPR